MIKNFRFNKITILIIIGIICILSLTANPQLLWLCMTERPTVVIDPGHGGNDPGAIIGDIFEKDINLDVSKKLKNYLTFRGFKVIMTREDDKTLSLRERIEIANKEKPDIFISIHVNSNPDQRVNGMEVYWHTPQSKKFAEKIYKNLNDDLLASRNRGMLNSRFYVIRKTNIPATLIEIGYLTNYYDRYEMLNVENQGLIVNSIGSGIMDYIKSAPELFN